VSRCGKTPLSIFLGQRGYKVRACNLTLMLCMCVCECVPA
jgi:regulator of PEP synthase PpsR (kinase-PPPase family)